MSDLTQSQADDIKEYTYGLNLLCVSSNQDPCYQFVDRYGSFFRQISLASSAAEGFELFSQNLPDLIIVSHPLPDCDTFDFLGRFPEHPNRIPSIIHIDFVDLEFVSKALNLGVSRFIPKSRTPEDTLLAIRDLARDIFARKTLSTLLNQEMELLRYRTRYHSQQQELALRKEQHLLRNDLSGGLLLLEKGEGEFSRWFLGVVHKPHDIMCGDSYIIRQLSSGDLLVFLVDAMGSGLSASLTAVSATSCVNFLIDLYERENRFDFQRLVDCFISHCRTILLDDEVISFGFMYFGASSGVCNCALFALPPLLVTTSDGAVIKIRGENPPVTNLTQQWKSQFITLDSCNGLMLQTDGLGDAETVNSGLFSERLIYDLEETFTAGELLERFRASVKKRDDDMTFVRFSKISECKPFFNHLVSDPTCSDITAAMDAFELSLQSQIHADPEWNESMIVAVGEAMINALEHGCLGMGGGKKQQLIISEKYDHALSQKAYSSQIELTAEYHVIGKRAAIIVFVADSGEGFNVRNVLATEPSRNDFQGRGKAVISSMVDHLSYNCKGTTACLLKYLPEENLQ